MSNEIIYVCHSINNKNIRESELKILRKYENKLYFEFGESELNLKKRFYNDLETLNKDYKEVLELKNKQDNNMTKVKEQEDIEENKDEEKEDKTKKTTYTKRTNLF